MIASGARFGLGRFDRVERRLAEPAVDAQARPRTDLDVHVRGALLDGEAQQSIEVQHADRGIDRVGAAAVAGPPVSLACARETADPALRGRLGPARPVAGRWPYRPSGGGARRAPERGGGPRLRRAGPGGGIRRGAHQRDGAGRGANRSWRRASPCASASTSSPTRWPASRSPARAAGDAGPPAATGPTVLALDDARVRPVLAPRCARIARRARRHSRAPVPRDAVRRRSRHSPVTRSRAGRATRAISSGSRCTRRARRLGLGHALVADAMHWLWRQGVVRSYVNTQLENQARARALRVVRFPACSRRASRCWGVHCEGHGSRIAVLTDRARARERRVAVAPAHAQTERRAHRRSRSRRRTPWTPERRHVHDGPEDERRTPTACTSRSPCTTACCRAARSTRRSRRQPDASRRPSRCSDFSLDDYPADASGVRVVQRRPRPASTSAAPGNGVYPIEVQLRDAERHTARRLRHPRRGRRPLGRGPEAARRRLGLAARRRPRARARRHPRPRRRQPSSRPPADSAGRPRRSAPTPTCPSRSPRAPRRSTRGSTLAQARTTSDLAAGVAALRRAVAAPPGARRPVRAARPPVTLRRRARRHARQRARPGQRHAPDASSAPTSTRAPRCPGNLDTASLDALRTASRTRLVVDGSALEPFDGRFTATRPALLGRTAGRRVRRGDASSPPIPASSASSQGDEAPALAGRAPPRPRSR